MYCEPFAQIAHAGRRLVAGCGAVVVLGSGLLLAAAPEDEPANHCTLKPGPTATVVGVIDAETVLLDDHRQVRLVGALAPRSFDLRPGAKPWPPEDRAAAALAELVTGRAVELAYGKRRTDRYGRLLAHLFIERDGERVWVQGRLLSMGQARAYGLPGSFECLAELMAHERAAREARVGLWSLGTYAPRSAEQSRALLRLRNSYTIVKGRIAHVAPTKARTYLNFGTDWRSDFTAGIEARALRDNPQWAQTLAAMEGKEVEVRGWIVYRNGPYIDIEHPGQIEIIEPGMRPPISRGPQLSTDKPSRTPKRKRPGREAPGAVDL